jgi:hypothetical protein
MRVRNNFGYSDEYAVVPSEPVSSPLTRGRFVEKRQRRDSPTIVRGSFGVLPGSDLDVASSALPGTQNIFAFDPSVVGGVRGYDFAQERGSAGTTRRFVPSLPTPAFVPRGASPLPTPRLTPTPVPIPIPRGGPGPAGVVNMWKVTPATPPGYFTPSVPEGAYYPETGAGRFRYVPGVSPYRYVPRSPMLPGEAFFRFLFGRRSAPSSTPSTAAASSASTLPLLPAYDLFQPGVFGPGIDAATQDPALAKVREEESRSFPFLPVLLLGGGAFLAYRVVRGKKGEAKAA